MIIRCNFCGKKTNSRKTAEEQDWVPNYWQGGKRVDQPVCPNCSAVHLHLGKDGETELRDTR